MQSDQLISTRVPDLIIVNKKGKENLANIGLCHPSSQRVKLKEREKIDKCLDLARELKNL